MNSVHLKILKFISPGKTKWVCSWPYFNAEIGNWAMTCLRKVWVMVQFLDAQCCAWWAGSQSIYALLALPWGGARLSPPPSQECLWSWGFLWLTTCPVFGIPPSGASQLLLSAWTALLLWICTAASFSMEGQLQRPQILFPWITSDEVPLPFSSHSLSGFGLLFAGLLIFCFPPRPHHDISYVKAWILSPLYICP